MHHPSHRLAVVFDGLGSQASHSMLDQEEGTDRLLQVCRYFHDGRTTPVQTLCPRRKIRVQLLRSVFSTLMLRLLAFFFFGPAQRRGSENGRPRSGARARAVSLWGWPAAHDRFSEASLFRLDALSADRCSPPCPIEYSGASRLTSSGTTNCASPGLTNPDDRRPRPASRC